MAKRPRSNPPDQESNERQGQYRPRPSPEAGQGAGLRPELFDEPLPPFVEPCLATLRAKVPAGDKWVHEIKWDGYRLQIRIDNGRVSILTRRGHDWTDRFPAIRTLPRRCP